MEVETIPATLITPSAIVITLMTLFPLSSEAAPVATPCELLTTAQLSAAFGGSVGAAKPVASTVCQWAQQGKPGDELLQLDVTLMAGDRYTRMKTVTAGTVTSVSGLGDDAYYSTLNTGHTTITTLNVKKGNAAVTIRVSGGTKPAQQYQAAEKTIAQALLPKL